MIRRPPRSTLFPTRRSSDLTAFDQFAAALSVQLVFTWSLSGRGSLSSGGLSEDRKSTRLNSSHGSISYAVFCLKKKKKKKKNKRKIKNIIAITQMIKT